MADRIPLIINASANQIQELPLADALLIHAGAGKGLEFTNNPGGGTGDLASITYEVVSGESTKLKIAVADDGSGANQDNIELSTANGASVNITANTVSTSKDTGALIVEGGVGIEKKLFVGDDVNIEGGQLNLTGTSAVGDSDITLSGGSDAIAVVTCRGTISNSSQLSIDCRNKDDNGDLRVGSFKVSGTNNKKEFICSGEITATEQPTCLLTNVTDFFANNLDNDVAIPFDATTTNVGCTVNASRSRITLPSAGTYLVSAMVSGTCSGTAGQSDSVQLYLRRNGTTDTSAYPNTEVYPRSVFGEVVGEEFFLTFTLPLSFNANDFIEIALREINSSAGQADIKKGYFSVTKLH